MTSRNANIVINRAVRFLKKAVVAMLASVFVFTALMIVTYYVKGAVPDTLVSEFFAFFKIEGGAMCLIKIVEMIFEKLAELTKKKKAARSRRKNEGEKMNG
jgi:hypothetical protein